MAQKFKTTILPEQWLYLRDIENKRPNEALFADFEESLRDAFRQETDLFLDSVLRGTAHGADEAQR